MCETAFIEPTAFPGNRTCQILLKRLYLTFWNGLDLDQSHMPKSSKLGALPAQDFRCGKKPTLAVTSSTSIARVSLRSYPCPPRALPTWQRTGRIFKPQAKLAFARFLLCLA